MLDIFPFAIDELIKILLTM